MSKKAGIIKSKIEYSDQVNMITNGEYEVIEDYVNTHTKILHKHTTCGNIYPVTPNKFLYGRRCPVCANNGVSAPETEISEYIEEIYDGEILKNDRTLLNTKELDIYLPDENIAIEYDGLYWHSDEYKDKKIPY